MASSKADFALLEDEPILEERDAGDIKRATRWSKPFGNMTEADVLEVLQKEPFRTMCPDLKSAKREAFISFGVPISVYGILANDTRIRHYRRGEFVMRRGDYGNSAFYLLEGSLVHIGNPHLDESMLGRKQPVRKSVFASVLGRLRDLVSPAPPEYRKPSKLDLASEEGGTGVKPEEVKAILKPGAYDQGMVRVGEIAGEIGAIYRTPRPQTVIASEDSKVLEIRWQGLRDLMDIDPAMARHIHELYREHRLEQDLQNSRWFGGLKPEQLRLIQLKTYGKYDEWSADYLEMDQEERYAVIETEEVIAEEGDYPNGVYLVQAGFARESRRYGHGHQTLNYLTAGHIFGLKEILYNAQHRKHPVPYQHSLRAISYAHVLFVPTRIVEEHVLAKMTEDEKNQLLKGFAPMREDEGAVEPVMGRQVIGADLLEFLVENRFLNGTKTMLINLDRCTRCDDCVSACAAAHDNNPRFVRHGPIHGNFMVANACMHCADPVCMIGCPTGAIHRESFAGHVVVNEDTCIGCATCYNNCPYDAIRMTAIRDGQGEFVLATAGEHEGSPIYKATKCDLCVDQPGGPACQRACPHDALRRLNMHDLQALAKFVKE